MESTIGRRRGGRVRAAFAALVLWLAGPAAAVEGPTLSPAEVGSGQLLFRTGTPGRFRPAPTVSTDVAMAIHGMVARVTVTQAFTNPGGGWREGVYVFPLPGDAAVDHMRMRIGERVVEGIIQERARARATYERAKAAGRKASLVSQERPNIFTNAVANIGPGETVRVTIEYQQSLRPDNGRFAIRFPMVVAPRFIPGRPQAADERLGASGGSGWAFATDQVPDAPRITPPVVPPGGGPVNPVRLTVALDAGFPLARVESRHHRAEITRPDAERARVTVEAVPADRDFELVWAPRAGRAPRAALFTEAREDADYALVMITPPAGAGRERLPRDVTFIVDTSGSMGGRSIVQARAALEMAVARLGPGDRFNIIRFADSAASLHAGPRPADAAVKARARGWIRGLHASGGTRMAPALERALTGREAGGRVHQVVFLTDGAVGNESALFGIIERRLGASRLFTVGIGSAPNGHFMTRAARFGRGTYTYIGRLDEVRARMTELFRKLEAPVLSGIRLEWPDGTEAETYPARIPDLYAGEPVVVAAKLARLGGEVRLHGVRAGAPFRVGLPLAGGRTGEGIGVLWARRRIAALMDTLHRGADRARVRAAVVQVALRHHLVSRYTSLVAVDRTPSRPPEAPVTQAAVPTNLPAGWEYDKVFGRLPQTATPAPLWLLAGFLLMGLGVAGCIAGRGRA